MEKQKILNHLKDAHRFLEMLEQKFPKARNDVNNVGWCLQHIKEEINKPDMTVSVPVIATSNPQIAISPTVPVVNPQSPDVPNTVKSPRA